MSQFDNMFGADWLAQLQGIPGSLVNGMGTVTPNVSSSWELPDMSGGGAGNYGPNWAQKGNLALNGLQTIAGLWGAFQAAKLAKKQFKFTKEVTNTNLNNQIRSYNTALADRARSRAVVEGQSQDQMQRYIDENSARRG